MYDVYFLFEMAGPKNGTRRFFFTSEARGDACKGYLITIE